MKSKLLQWFAIFLILEIGLLHIFTAQKEYDKAAYMGYLFAANFFGALVAAFGIYHRKLWGWILGLGISIGSIAGYMWSRTLGMPGMNVEEWFSPYGIISMSLEGAFILLYLFRSWKVSEVQESAFDNSRLRYILPMVVSFLIVSTSAVTVQWDYAVTQALGHHVGSLAQVCSTPPLTFAQLDEQYGVRISLVANSMMDSVVDVRLKITDPDKAHMLLQNQAALLVGQQTLILAPHMHSHHTAKLKAAKIYFMFFPTQQIIHPGSSVSLVFGSVRTEPVVVR